MLFILSPIVPSGGLICVQNYPAIRRTYEHTLPREFIGSVLPLLQRIYYPIKKETRKGSLLRYVISELHEVLNLNTSVVAVLVNLKSSKTLICTFGKWVSNKTISCLKSNFWLEGVLSHSTNHL